MKLSETQLQGFSEDGFVVIPELFSMEEIALMRSQLSLLFSERCAENFREKDSGVVRTAMGLHVRNEVFARVVRHPRLLEPAMQLLDEDIYIQQVKVNAKEAFSGEVWQWHYDFATHHGEDGVPKPLALNLHIFLDDVNEFNGPLTFIRGSHKYGPAPTSLDTVTTSYPLWTVDKETVKALVAKGGLFAAKGLAGTALIFGDTLVHGSSINLSPWPRRIFSLIVNPVSNALTRYKRPEHQHHRDLTPVTPLADDCLLAKASA
jgi:ectoine hydroxylase